jgi:hypothetical protein
MIAGKFAGGEGAARIFQRGGGPLGARREGPKMETPRVLTLVALCRAAWLTKEGTVREVGRTLTV